MITSPCRLPCSLLLALVACQEPAAEGGGAAELATRLDAVDRRLEAIEGKLDALTTRIDATASSIDPLVEWAKVQKALEDEREAKRLEREARRAELGERPNSFSRLFGRPSGSSSGPLDPAPGPELPGAAEGVQCTEPRPDRIECSVDRAFLDHLLASSELLYKQARVVPSQRDGVLNGFKLYGIRSGSLPKLLGLKNGDRITAVNGHALRGVDDAMEVYTKLRTAKRFEVELERKAAPMELVVEVVE